MLERLGAADVGNFESIQRAMEAQQKIDVLIVKLNCDGEERESKFFLLN